MRISFALPLFLSCFAWESVAHAEERYYIILFGSQSTPRLARFTHTWATFVKTRGEGGDASKYQISEIFTISWMPADLKVRALRLRPQEGVNLDLESTLSHSLERQRVSEWGPFEISPMIYNLALERKAELESGAVRYKAIDPTFGPRAASICRKTSTGSTSGSGSTATRLSVVRRPQIASGCLIAEIL
jgi:hypothetical protein